MDDVSVANSHSCLVPLVGDDDMLPAFKRSAEHAAKRTGVVANNVRAMANAPELGATMRQFIDDVWDRGDLPKPMKALIRHKVSNINACLYCSAHQVRVMQSQGIEQEKIDNMHAFRTHPAFSEKERAILAYAEAVTIDAGNVPEEVIAPFTELLTAQERVEVAVVAAAMGLLNKINDGLQVPLEQPMLEVARNISFDRG